MKRNELEALGLTAEQVNSVMAINGADIQGIRDQLNTANQNYTNISKELNDLKALGDIKDLQQKYSELEAKYNDKEKEMTTFKRDGFLRNKLGTKYHNADLVLEQILKTNPDLKLKDDNSIDGIDEIIKKFDEANPYLIKQDDSQIGKFLGSASQKATETSTNPNQKANDALRGIFKAE